MSDVVQAISKIRNEFPMDLLSAKRLWDQHGSYEAMREALLGFGFRPQDEAPIDRCKRLERQLKATYSALAEIHDMFINDVDASQEPGDEGKWTLNTAAKVINIIEAVLPEGISSRPSESFEATTEAADLMDGTWTFRPVGDFTVRAGRYRITRLDPIPPHAQGTEK